jgi:hypothetical protein
VKNKFMYLGVGIILILVLGSVILSSGVLNGNSIKEDVDNKNPELEKYRSEDIPEDCRLPEYESDLGWWKEHLSHHKETLYCLDYYN